MLHLKCASSPAAPLPAAPQDYVPMMDKEVVIPVGEQAVTVAVHLLHDRTLEKVEQFVVALRLKNEEDHIKYSLPEAATVIRIYDDEGPGVLQVRAHLHVCVSACPGDCH